MARGNQTTLTLRLIDGVSKPGRAVVNTINTVNRAIGGMRSGAMAATSKVTKSFANNLGQVQVAGAAAAVGVAALGRQILNSERALNKAMAAGNLSMADRAHVYDNAIKLNYKYGGSVDDVINAHTELLRSGLDLKNSDVALPDVMNLSQATGEDTISTARAIVTNLTALRLEMTQSARAADLFVQALDRTAGVDLIDFETSGKYFNPVAAATGMSAEEAMAFQVEMAKRGLFGSSSGTGLRAAPASILAPTKKGMAALQGLGIDPNKFKGKRTADATSDQVLGALGAYGVDTDSIEPQVAEIMKAKMAESEKIKAIIGQLGEQMGIVTAEDRSELTQTLTRAFSSGISEVDLFGFLKELQNKGAGFADYEAIFGRYHASKFLGFDPASYQEELGLMRTSAKGGTDRKAQMMMQGLPGDVNNAEGALQGLIAALSKAGVLSDFAKAAQTVAQTLEELSRQNPALLRLAFGVTVALAALAPLGLIATGAAAALALLVNPITLVGAAMATWATINWRAISNGFRTFGNHLRRSLDPSIMARMERLFGDRSGIFARMKVGNLSFNRMGADLGTGLGRGINAAFQQAARIRALAGDLVPRIRDLSSQLVAAGRGMWETFGPRIKTGLSDAAEGIQEIVMSRWDALASAGEAVGGFMERLKASFAATGTASISVAAEAINTLGAALKAIGDTSAAASDGFSGFVEGFFNKLDADQWSGIINAMDQGAGGALTTFANDLKRLNEELHSYSSLMEGIDWNSLGQTWGTNAAKGLNQVVLEFQQAPDQIRAELARYKAMLDGAGISDFMSSWVANANRGWGELKNVFVNMGAYVPSFDGLIGAVQSAMSVIAAAFERVVTAANAVRSTISSLGGNAPANVQAAANMVQPLPMQGPPMPRRAGGGSVRRGPYLVGERGPEVVNMGGNGYVTPNHKLGGGSGPVTINVHGAGDPEAVANRVMQKLNRLADRSQQIGMNR